jgi:hypothetical protein
LQCQGQGNTYKEGLIEVLDQMHVSVAMLSGKLRSEFLRPSGNETGGKFPHIAENFLPPSEGCVRNFI